MPQLIELQPLVNQSIDFVVDSIQYNMVIRQIADMVIVDITRDNAPVLSGQRATTQTPLIPYKYLQGNGGNFIFSTQLDQLVDTAQFGTTQFLYYFSPDELAALGY